MKLKGQSRKETLTTILLLFGVGLFLAACRDNNTGKSNESELILPTRVSEVAINQEPPTYQCEDSSGNPTIPIYLFTDPPGTHPTQSVMQLWQEYISYVYFITCDLSEFWQLQFEHEPPAFVTHEYFASEQSLESRIAPHSSLLCNGNPPAFDVRGYYCTQTSTGQSSIVVNRDQMWTKYNEWNNKLSGRGFATIVFMLAHEWGHHIAWVGINERTGIAESDEEIRWELESECYTGAFWRYAIDNSNRLTVDYRQEDWTYWLNSLSYYDDEFTTPIPRDTPVTTVDRGEWKGIMLGEQLDALRLGFDGGVQACVDAEIEEQNDSESICAVSLQANQLYSDTSGREASRIGWASPFIVYPVTRELRDGNIDYMQVRLPDGSTAWTVSVNSMVAGNCELANSGGEGSSLIMGQRQAGRITYWCIVTSGSGATIHRGDLGAVNINEVIGSLENNPNYPTLVFGVRRDENGDLWYDVQQGLFSYVRSDQVTVIEGDCSDTTFPTTLKVE